MKKAKIKILSKQELRKIILDKKISLDTLDISNITNMRNIISNDNSLSLLFVESFSLWDLFKDIYEIKGSIANWDANERIINNVLLIVNEDKR